ncbi:unnamed protein product [Phytophthora fragariaefolia]|uniref:Unnamed protein product n=1 Tax=Phytophthora fragariaefolia TaxID=1490495 RepID=A0A9W7D0X5_9STRA|nr:unnamed protein product [Phytophthora fragariaefolia]
MAMCEAESITVADNSATDQAEFECSANEIDLEDYAHELAFLPDLTDSASTVLDYGGSNVVCSVHTPSQREKLVKALKAQEGIMIASGNALPPPAYGAICDIDVQGHKPIKQRARRVPLKHMKKLYEILKGLLKAGLIAFSNSPWASPIVLKKNGVDIRLCIDYKMVNAITVLMEYAMPLVDDLLTELEGYLWFCSLDAASGFREVMMPQRAREISAFVCALGHFEWLRMTFGLKNALLIYQRIIDNALWGYVQPRGGWASYAEKVPRTEAASVTQRGRLSDPNQPTPDSVNSATKFEADHRALAESDPLQDLVNSSENDMFANGEPDDSTLTPVFNRRSFVGGLRRCLGWGWVCDPLRQTDAVLRGHPRRSRCPRGAVALHGRRLLRTRPVLAAARHGRRLHGSHLGLAAELVHVQRGVHLISRVFDAADAPVGRRVDHGS